MRRGGSRRARRGSANDSGGAGALSKETQQLLIDVVGDVVEKKDMAPSPSPHTYPPSMPPSPPPPLDPQDSHEARKAEMWQTLMHILWGNTTAARAILEGLLRADEATQLEAVRRLRGLTRHSPSQSHLRSRDSSGSPSPPPRGIVAGALEP